MTWFKIVAMYAVVLIHTYNAEVYDLQAQTDTLSCGVYLFEQLCGALLNLAVPFFYMASGYLLYRNYSSEVVLSKYKSRFHMLFIPYIFWITFGLIYFSLLTHLPVISNMMNMEPKEISFLAWLNALQTVEVDPPLWFLRDLIVYVLFSPLIYVLLKNWHFMSGLVVLFFVFVLRIYYPAHSVLIQPAFFVGAYIGINAKNLPYLLPGSKQRLWIALAAVGCACYAVCSVISPIGTQIVLDVIHMALAGCLWYAVGNIKSSVPQFLGSMTFFVYASHEFLLEGLEKIWLKAAGTAAWAALLDYLVMPVLTVAILYACGKLLSKYCKIIWGLVNAR